MVPAYNDLKNFVEIASTLNLSRAAERLGVSQPSLTQSLRKLEECLGTSLFVRSKTGLKMTRSGETFLVRAKKFLDDWNSLVRATTEEDSGFGTFRIGCHASVGGYSLPQFFKNLEKKAPHIKIELAHDISRRITESVISGKLDLGFVVNPVEHPDLVIKKIGLDEFSIFESKKLRRSHKIFYVPELSQSNYVLQNLKKHKIPLTDLVATTSLELVSLLTLRGVGYGIMPKRIAQSISSTELVQPFEASPSYSDKICLIYRKEFMYSKAAKLLVEIASTPL